MENHIHSIMDTLLQKANKIKVGGDMYCSSVLPNTRLEEIIFQSEEITIILRTQEMDNHQYSCNDLRMFEELKKIYTELFKKTFPDYDLKSICNQGYKGIWSITFIDRTNNTKNELNTAKKKKIDLLLREVERAAVKVFEVKKEIQEYEQKIYNKHIKPLGANDVVVCLHCKAETSRLDFWTSYCPACRSVMGTEEEVKHLQKLQRELFRAEEEEKAIKRSYYQAEMELIRGR